MGSNSGPGPGTGVIDCCVGTIVWVRRRNGSWWPGKIVGSDELSASHLMSPRSGTPVKLLGREDASVDWYNLEKSKRVKAFRCGEFDDCIERAEAAQGIPPKKREKYARREDAIFHALELEKQLLEKKYGKLGSSSDAKKGKLPDGVNNELATSPECLEQSNRKHAKPKSHQHVNPKSHRMRGLKDFGLGTALSKISEKPAFDDSDHALSNGARTSENLSHATGKDFSDKRKSSHDGLAEESLIKRRDKRSPLVQVLESSEKVLVSHSLQPDGGSVPLSKSSECLVNKEMDLDQMEISTFKFEESNCSHPAGEEIASGSTEDTETDSAESDMDGATAALSDDVETIELRPKILGRSEAKMEHGCTSSDGPDDMALASEIPTPISASVEVSKWQMKGKRNKRGLTKRYPNAASTRASKGSSHASEKKTRTQMVGYGSRGSNGISESGWNIRTQIGDSMLVDVDLKVQSSYQKEHVPMISLMSKFNRKAIIGHPIQVEKLENGSTENLLTAAANYISPETLDSNTSVPPVWRTTNCRAPRPRSSSTLDGEDRNRQVISRKPNASMMRDNISHAPRPKKHGKSARKTPKRLGLSLSPKIRTLSSIGQQQKHSNEPKHGLLMKPASGPTTVACIPVKLVFSRLYEELVNRHQ